MRGPTKVVVDGVTYDVWESDKPVMGPITLKMEFTEEDLMEMMQDVPVVKDAKAALVHLKEGDILVLRVDEDTSPESMHMLATQMRRMIKETGRTNVAMAILRPGMDLDILQSDKVVGQLRAEIAELKATVAKYVTK